jgi:ZIP family zinc transporter
MSLIDMLLNIGGDNLILLGLIGGLVTSSLNMLGALPVFVLKTMSQKMTDVGLGFSAGVMLAASFTSLILPGLELAGLMPVIVGFAIGALFVSFSDIFLPHMHPIIGKDSLTHSKLKAVWLFTIAVTIHNMPEGLAVGVSFGSGDLVTALALMWGIGLQNMPEGLSIAFAMAATKKYSRSKSFLIAAASGLVEVPLALIGAALVAQISWLMPYAMGFAAGAMIYVISDEIVPETHRLGHERLSTYGLIVGFIVMLSLDYLL